MKNIEIKLANPRGFCAGVDRAIEIVEHALERFGAPIYVRHEIVHNRYVVDNLKAKGVHFVEEIAEVPNDSIVIFSAHGVSQAVQQAAKTRNLKIFDATCPLVSKVHMEVIHYSKEGREVVLIGHQGHPEVEGTMGQYNEQYGGKMYLVENCQDAEKLTVNNPNHLAFVSQTTLSVDDAQDVINCLKARFPAIQGPKRDDICYATQNRQDAVKKLAQEADLVLVVGSKNSSNSNRLREIAQKLGIDSYLIDNAEQIEKAWLENKTMIGITAGASAPEILVKQVVEKLKVLSPAILVNELDGITENLIFTLPKELRS